MTHREEKATVQQALGYHSTRLAQLNAKIRRKELMNAPLQGASVDIFRNLAYWSTMVATMPRKAS